MNVFIVHRYISVQLKLKYRLVMAYWYDRKTDARYKLRKGKCHPTQVFLNGKVLLDNL